MPTIVIVSLNADPTATLGGDRSGGQCGYVRELATRLPKHGWEPHVFTIPDPVGDADPTATSAFSLHGVRLLDNASYDAAICVDSVDFICDQIRERLTVTGIATDVILACYWTSGLAAMRLARELQCPFAVSFCSLGVFKQAAYPSRSFAARMEAERLIARAADCVLAATHAEAVMLATEYSVPLSKMTVIPRGVNTNVFYPDAESSLCRPADAR